MRNYKQTLKLSGFICFGLALFQIAIGFSPSISLYFGAPEALVENIYTLIFVSILIAGVLALFGFYALSGAGSIQRLPFLKQALVAISSIYLLRGLLLIPEFLVVVGAMEVSIPVAPRFVIFSIGSLLIGIIFTLGTIGGWKSFATANKKSP